MDAERRCDECIHYNGQCDDNGCGGECNKDGFWEITEPWGTCEEWEKKDAD